MSINNMSYSTVFSKNRAEEMPDDVWGKYVLPINYKEVCLRKWTKATIIIGGRGSGKTMFLKYHCHPTIFSKKRENPFPEMLKMIGIYWRPDTSFTQLLNENWLGKSWNAAFISFMCLSILIEYSRLINNIIQSNIADNELKSNLENLELPRMIQNRLTIDDEKILIKDAEDLFQSALFDLCAWINLPQSDVPPINLDLKLTLILISKRINSCSALLTDSIYHIYVDEFENLTQPQQKIINTWMKHGIPPLLFSAAYKKNADVTHETTGTEKIVPRNDYRILDLEDVFSQDFELLAAEVLALRLLEKQDVSIFEIIKEYSNEEKLAYRNENKYKKQVKQIATEFLPEKSHHEISIDILSDSVLMKKLHALIDDGLKFHKASDYTPSDFIDASYPEASLINGILLNRKANHPDSLSKEFEKYKIGTSEDKYKNWIPNNLVGAILYIYSKSPTKYCPLYAGFRQFVLMSKGNLRHFLELCHQSILKSEFEQLISEKENIYALPVETQAKATYMTSSLELEKISDLGANGLHLKRVARRLGILFSHSQNRRSQSEPEVNHFTLDLSDKTQLSEKTQRLLNEALVWSVLFEEDSTKTKSDDTTETKDYILHPVLSAFFKISYRKKRKLKLKAIEVEAIFNGEEDDFLKILKTYKDRWGIGNSDEALSIFEDNSGGQLWLL